MDCFKNHGFENNGFENDGFESQWVLDKGYMVFAKGIYGFWERAVRFLKEGFEGGWSVFSRRGCRIR